MITDTRTRADIRRSDEESGSSESGRRVPVLVWQLPLSIVVAALVSLVTQWCLARVDIPADSFVPEAVMNLSCLLLLAALLGLAALPRWSRGIAPLSWGLLSALGTLPLGLLLRGSRFYLYGLSGDQLFRTQYLTRLTDSASLADPNYAGLPPFYPAGWFWLGGRFANVLGVPAWEAYKPWAIMTMAVAPVIAGVLWSAVVRRSVAVLLATLCCLAGLRVAAYEPYSWLLVVIMVPVAVILWRDLRSWVSGRGSAWSAAVLAGLCLGVCAAVYTLLALYFAAVLCSLMAWAAWQAHRSPGEARVSGAVARLAAAGACAAPLTAVVWAPYLLGRAQHSAAPNPAARFLPEAGAQFPFPMLDFTVSGAICALGTVWVLWSWRRSEITQALSLLIVGCYAWYAASMLALFAGTTLLAFRAEPVLLACLFAAGGLAGVEIVRWAGERVGAHRAAVSRIALAGGLMSSLVLVQTMEPTLEKTITSGLVDRAYQTYDDTGQRPSADGPSDGAWNGQLIAAIGAQTRKPPRDLVVLSTVPELFAFRAYRGFQVVSPAYANPLAGYDQRRLLVESWSRTQNPHELATALNRSPFAPPSVFVFSRGDGVLRMSASRDTFPKSPNAQSYTVDFPEKLFDSPEFSRRDVGPYTVVTRN